MDPIDFNVPTDYFTSTESATLTVSTTAAIVSTATATVSAAGASTFSSPAPHEAKIAVAEIAKNKIAFFIFPF
jgi:hypothetical protein